MCEHLNQKEPQEGTKERNKVPPGGNGRRGIEGHGESALTPRWIWRSGRRLCRGQEEMQTDEEGEHEQKVQMSKTQQNNGQKRSNVQLGAAEL